MADAPPYTQKKPAYVVTQTPEGIRVLARFFENNRQDTATVLVPDAFSTKIGDTHHELIEEHYSVHSMTKAEGRLLKWTAVFEPPHDQTTAALVECKPRDFIWLMTSRRYALDGLGQLQDAADGVQFAIPDYDPMLYTVIAGIIAADVDRELPTVNGWGRVDVIGNVFRIGFYYTFLMGSSDISTGAINHITSAPRINKVPLDDYQQPAKPLREGKIALSLAQDRSLLIEREQNRREEFVRSDPNFFGVEGSKKYLENSRWANRFPITDPAAHEAKYGIAKKLAEKGI